MAGGVECCGPSDNGSFLMRHTPEFLAHLVRAALGRGSEESLAPPALPGSPIQDASGGPIPTDAPSSSEPAAPDRPAGEFDTGIVNVLAEKILLAWLRNRYQLLFPFALDLRRLDEQQAELLVHAMIAAAQADGSFDGKERRRIEGILDLVDSNDEERAFLETLVSRSKPLNEILKEVHDTQTGALVYAASLMAVDQRKPVNRYYLRYLAARLQLSEELVGSLEQRYRSSG